ncbi:MAG: C69 family dipeptidase [Candidatus Aminicenantes bacterium]|nr:C69 family dipeptidase [Candidatus Aminicenantes bacterium]
MKTVIKIILTIVVLVVLTFNLAAAALACDTWVALRNATARGITLFAKNSDRPLFDSQPLILHPRALWPEGAQVDLGRVRIPQVRETFATLGSSPYWCWGYEEGINEFGVAIGNEGVGTKPLREMIAAAAEGKSPALGPTGMDLLRLGLERGRTAKEALDVITSLIERYGQFGSGTPGAGLEGAYDNSFIIADAREAWILETAGRQWVAKRVAQGTASISNKLSLAKDWDMASKDLVGRAAASGWWPKEKVGEFDFTAAYINDSPSALEGASRARTRQACSAGLLAGMSGRVTVKDMMRIARDRSSTPSIDLDQTASSCIAEIPAAGESIPVFWWCAATPSRSCYIPFFVHGRRLPEILSTAGSAGRGITAPEKASRDGFAENSFWWLFRDLCDRINADEATRLPIARAEFDALEKDFAAGVPDVMNRASELRRAGRVDEAAAVLDAYSESCVGRVLEKARKLRGEFSAPAAVPAEFLPYVGTYAHASGPLAGREFKVLFRNGKLAVDIPGQMVVDLNEPDAKGIRSIALSRDVAFSFESGPDGPCVALNLHQATTFPRQPAADPATDPNAPADLAPLLGTYGLPVAKIEFAVRFLEGGLALDIKGQGIVRLEAPDEQGLRAFGDDPTAKVSFVQDASGTVTALKLHRTVRFPRKAD